ncbi:hypothetical protein N431DRAFT_174916 [Stipitochalara longipes BDJ]|nr:hypothetical protein N431DRAFT_174916 [Stipitochalara longipes BDJ]
MEGAQLERIRQAQVRTHFVIRQWLRSIDRGEDAQNRLFVPILQSRHLVILACQMRAKLAVEVCSAGFPLEGLPKKLGSRRGSKQAGRQAGRQARRRDAGTVHETRKHRTGTRSSRSQKGCSSALQTCGPGPPGLPGLGLQLGSPRQEGQTGKGLRAASSLRPLALVALVAIGRWRRTFTSCNA